MHILLARGKSGVSAADSRTAPNFAKGEFIYEENGHHDREPRSAARS
jgi:hypothetical protein